MLYELTTLSSHILKIPEVIKNAETYLRDPESSGEWLGAWTVEHGRLGTLRILRGFSDAGMLSQERERALYHPNPFGAEDNVSAIEMESYAGFPFLPDVKPGQFGKYYEFRTYWLRPGGLPPTIAAWEAAMPERSKRSPLTVNMYALDGAPRITHLWPWESLDERIAIRTKTFEDGTWPPKGGPQQFHEATSTIWLPTANSPLR
jgi:NIPSNAP